MLKRNPMTGQSKGYGTQACEPLVQFKVGWIQQHLEKKNLNKDIIVLSDIFTPCFLNIDHCKCKYTFDQRTSDFIL